MKFKLNAFYNMDCMEALRNIEDKYFDLAIVDPPYFSGPERREFFGRSVSPIGVQRLYRESEKWSVPTTEYFDELFRVSKNQIIWGCNYFDYQFGPGRIVWDKCNGTSSFSDAEIAYCSMQQGKSMMRGDIQQGNKALNEKRIHPTQKPVNLYKWLLTKYAKLGDKILDTHVGSGSSLIACCDLGYEYLGFEIDEGYFKAAVKRIEEFNAQTRIQIEQMELRV